MPLFKKKPPPQWFVLRPSKSSSSTSEPTREGPYTRASITKMYGEGLLGDGALIWTNEKIFPNAQKPNSARPVRIMEWRRLDQLPDPVVRQLEADWQQMNTPQSMPDQQNAQTPTNPDIQQDQQTDSTDSIPPTAPPPPPPEGGTPAGAQPQHAYPAPTSMYPAGVNQPPPQQQYPPAMNNPQMDPMHQSTAYPAPAQPPPASGAY